VAASKIDRSSGVQERVIRWFNPIHARNRVENYVALRGISLRNQAVQLYGAEFQERTVVGHWTVESSTTSPSEAA
jgi:hypothetical protein